MPVRWSLPLVAWQTHQACLLATSLWAVPAANRCALPQPTAAHSHSQLLRGTAGQPLQTGSYA